MKALLIQNYGSLGGGSKSVLDVAELLKRNGLDVEIAINEPTKNILDVATQKGFRVINDHPSMVILNYHSASGLACKTWIRYAVTRKNLKYWRVFFKTHNYDLVVLNSSVLCPLASVLKSLNINFYIYIRETFRKGLIINKIQRMFISQASAALFLTDFDRRHWNANIRSYVIPEIIEEVDNDDIYCSALDSENKTTFLYLGGINYFKGALDLLKAVEYVVRRNKIVQVYILGSTYDEYDELSFLRKLISLKHVLYRRKCFNYIEKINLMNKDAIVLIGLTPKIENYYLASNAVVFPVKKVHQPRPAYEAGLYKKPIVVPNYDNFQDFITDGYNGYYYEKNNILSLVEVLETICDDHDEAMKRGANNYCCTKKNHSFEKADTIIRVILEETRY